MELLDEYQDQGMGTSQPPPTVVDHHAAAANAMAGIAASITHHRHNSESPMSHPEEDLSDPDRQDEESGEELPQQPLQGNNHSPPGAAAVPAPLTHLNNLMNSTHPHFLAKIKLENDMDLLSNKTSLEALQAAMSSNNFNALFPFPGPNFLTAAVQNPHLTSTPTSQHHQSQHSHSQSNNNNNSSSNGNNALPSSASSHSSESSHGSGRNGLETSNTPLGHRDVGDGGGSSAVSVHSQSGSQAGGGHQQQPSWSFEEQFKQLYEINDDPKRKEFLDDLFSFMQKRGTPINRLPIMAKSVLDLYELYNLVIARGGLVDVINKKLWQEIIKGLHLPSSITSAAFTLRTQYMKYLYPYECEKKHLSTPAELQAAIDGNRREGRRSNYGGAYGGSAADSLVHQRSPHTPSSLASLHAQINPLSLVTAVQQAAAAGGQHQVNPQNLVNGSAAHTPLSHHPHHPQSLQGGLGQPQNAGVAPEFEVRMAEYVKHLQREMDARRRAATSPPSALMSQQQQQQQHRSGSSSPPAESPSREQAALYEMSRLTLWNMYNNNLHPGLNYAQHISPQQSPQSPPPNPTSPEPQKEALDLGLRSSPGSTSPPTRQSPPSSSGGSIAIKREIERCESMPEPTAHKRLCIDEDSPAENHHTPKMSGTHIKISNRGDGRDNSMVVSMEINGVMYQGVLFAQTDGRSSLAAASTNNNEAKTSSRNVVS